MKYKCVIIEDEPLAANKVKYFVDKHPDLEHTHTFEDPLKALKYLDQAHVDIIFLDIQMKQLTGIEFLKTIETDAKIVMTTAYSEYAIEGYELQVTDYLLKPFSFSRFVKAMEKVKSELKEPATSDFIFVKTEYHLEKVVLQDILFIKGMRDYLQIVTKSTKIMTLDKFSTYEEKLPTSNFCRVHKSFLVSISKIEKIERNRIYINSDIIPIGEAYKDAFLKKINF